MKGDDFNLIQMEIERSSNDSSGPSQLALQLENLAASSRSLESALNRERTYSRQLREYVNSMIARLHFLQKQEKEHIERLQDLQASSDKNGKRATELSSELERIRQELERYKAAWSQVIAREKHAQFVLSRAELTEKRIQDLEAALAGLDRKYTNEKNNREKAEQHSASHRAELQSALVRLHSSEARYNDMARELEAVHSLRKNHALEISRVQEEARESAEAAFYRRHEELQQEIERERARLERQLAESEQARNKTKIEAEMRLASLSKDLEARFRQELQQQLQSQIQKAKSEWEQQLLAERQRLESSAQQEISHRDGLIRSLGEEAKNLRGELSQSREEVAATEQVSRQSQMDLIRTRDEAQALKRGLDEERRKREELERNLARMEQSLLQSERDEVESLREILQSEKRQMRHLIERLLTEWGSEDPALRDALLVLRDACEVRHLRSSEIPSKLEIVASSPKLSC